MVVNPQHLHVGNKLRKMRVNYDFLEVFFYLLFLRGWEGGGMEHNKSSQTNFQLTEIDVVID